MRDLKLTHLGRFAEEKIDNSGENLDPAHPTPLFVCPILLLAHPVQPVIAGIKVCPSSNVVGIHWRTTYLSLHHFSINGFSALFAAVNPDDMPLLRIHRFYCTHHRQSSPMSLQSNFCLSHNLEAAPLFKFCSLCQSSQSD